MNEQKTQQNTQPQNMPDALNLISKLEAALNVPYHESQVARAEQAKILAMQHRAANAPLVDWQPPPEGPHLKDWVRLILSGSDAARESRFWLSAVRDFNLEAADGSMVRVVSLDHSLPLWIEAKYVSNGNFGRDNRELQKSYDAGFLSVQPATLDGEHHYELHGLPALKLARWTAVAFFAAIEAGREPPRTDTARLVAAMVKAEQPRLAKVLALYGSGALAISEGDRQVLYPAKTLNSPEGQGGFQPVGALVES